MTSLQKLRYVATVNLTPTLVKVEGTYSRNTETEVQRLANSPVPS